MSVKEFVTAVAEDEKNLEEEDFVEFKLDGRLMKAYTPTSGQLVMLNAGLGRGQTDDQRFATILNFMFGCLEDADKDHLESRLLDRSKRHRMNLDQLEEIFEYLMEEWFGRPTKPSTDSASTQ